MDVPVFLPADGPGTFLQSAVSLRDLSPCPRPASSAPSTTPPGPRLLGPPLTACCVSLDTREFAQASALSHRREPPPTACHWERPSPLAPPGPTRPRESLLALETQEEVCGAAPGKGLLLLTGTQAEHQDETDIRGGGRQDYGKSHPPQAHSGQTVRFPLQGSLQF